MDAEALTEQIQETLASLFRRGSRYQTEKLVTLAGYLLISIASLVWAFSGSNANNKLGASFGKTRIEEIDEQVYFLRNDGSEDWTNVRVVLNRQYLYKRDKLEAGDRATLGRKDFAYFYYIPRAWGLDDWEHLGEEEKPAETAPPSMIPNFVEIRADQGRIDIDLTRPENQISE